MKLYVWENVLCDWTCGMIVALAPDLETAFIVARQNPDAYAAWYEAMGGTEPTIIDLTAEVKPQVWGVYGGG